MSDNVIGEIFNITEDADIEFKEICGFIFAVQTKIILINDKISSAEIKPLGIIYSQKKDFFFAPLDENADVEEIVEKFVME